eukprot:CAMPEP_0173160262 /NCGR_PEP_ID=MMETSP1105-20130129/17726_1 /TAXON_ID=2985 /ORGANISM="Ochromonas sp., Strain BG-1" /LENGTH=323 /DNA_ID=CAMNT_0014079105 /DNA_START=35 /DNA_END=1006 /DNA_ORIENTATION=-
MKSVQVQPKVEPETERIGVRSTKKKQEPIRVPPYHESFFRLIDAGWLAVCDDIEENANQNFIGANLNISLISALFFTTFVPLYYTEAQRLNDSNDGLTIDIASGYLSPVVDSNQFLHDLFDCTYFIAVAGTAIGTVTAVFFMLAGNEVPSDSQTFVLLRMLGPKITQLPYYFFSFGVCAWIFAMMVHGFMVPRTGTGFGVKLALTFASIFIFYFFGLPRLIRGVYLARSEAQKHPSVLVSKERIATALENFFAKREEEMERIEEEDHSLPLFLKSLSYLTEAGYRPKLDVVSRVEATCMYYEKLAEITGRSVEEVKYALEQAN